MFRPETYKARRAELKKLVGSGIILFPGNNESPFNYAGNPYHFRQDSSFLYYFGLDYDGLFGIIDVDNNEDILFGSDRSLEDVVWMGPEPTLAEKAILVGVDKTFQFDELVKTVKKLVAGKTKIHYLPQYRSDTIILLESLTGIKHNDINDQTSTELTKAVISQRSIKTDEEIAEMESAIGVSYLMNTAAMKMTQPGMIEREVFGTVEGIALAKGLGVSFPIIFSVHGETLHNHHHENTMKDGDIAILDSGAESNLHYASDITRSFPVNGRFSSLQTDIYNTVLRANNYGIQKMAPGITNKEIHLGAVKVIAEGLKELGLIKGNVDDAVEAGAHALFMPHGLGHLIGLDVHDMEGLGESLSGYDNKVKRSDQFGLAYLRFGKTLEKGMVLTVEPGIYFIPQLINNWKEENKHSDFINYGKTEAMIGFGGVRIEDDVLVTENGSRVLGKHIPKTVEEVEEACNA